MQLIARLATCWILVLALASCGGGGGGATGSNLVSSTPAGSSTAPAGSGGSTVATAPTVSLTAQSGSNVVPVKVSNEGGFADILYVSVTVCPPGASTGCETIPNIQVDTGSVGLRILSSAFAANQTTANQGATLLAALPNVFTNGALEAECAQFADGVSWGAVHSATVTMGGQSTTSAIPIQIIGDTTNSNIPTACSNAGTVEDTVQSLGANGIIGVGYFLQDCGPACASVIGTSELQVPVYYGCASATTCTGAVTALNLQLNNPVANFPAGFNNGNIIELPSVPDSGAATANGFLIFGVATQTNNALPTQAPLGVDNEGNISAVFNGSTLNQSFIDSGSSAYFFNDSAIPVCASSSVAPGFFCPTTTFNSSVTLTGNVAPTNSFPFNFSIGNAVSVFNATPTAYAFDNLGAPNSSTTLTTSATFDVGLPFFFGRSVYTVFEQTTAGGFSGPIAAIGTAS